ncbi:MAG: penicillin-binding protein 1A [Bacteroidales bacterium]|jgi:penicillin-binding protein 1A
MSAKKNKNIDEKQWIKRYRIAFLSFLGLVFLFFFMLSMGWLGFMPSFEELENPKSKLASEIISSDQKLLGTFYIENRSNVRYNELSPWLVKALISTEDIRFEKHSGIDTKAIARAIIGVFTGSKKGGGSTITQQLAKNLFPRKYNQNIFGTVYSKAKEWIVALKLERNYTKEEIIALYFNTVDFGSLSFGIKSAAKTYFDKAPIELNAQESATLVGILKAPSYFHPVRNTERAIDRRSVVLNQMRKADFITKQEYDSIKMLPLDVSSFTLQVHDLGTATYFREFLRKTLSAKKPNPKNYTDKADYTADSLRWERDQSYGWIEKNRKADGSKYNLYKDGLKIYTTINYSMQQYAEEAVNEYFSEYLQPTFFEHWKDRKNAPYDMWDTKQIDMLIENGVKRSSRYRGMKSNNVPDDSIALAFNTPIKMSVFSWDGDIDTVMTPLDSIKYHNWFLQTGLMSVEPQSGFVRAYVGGINYRHFQYDHVTQGRRQVGSTFKPFVYTVAIQDGQMTPCTRLANVPVRIESGGKIWEPKNSSKYKENEMITLKDALANSVNWISAALIKTYSPQAVINICRKMGIYSPIPNVPAISLGSADLSLYEMVGAMSTFANKGIYMQPLFITHIEDKHGNVISHFIPYQNEAMNAHTAYNMIGLLQGVVESGTGARIRTRFGLNYPIAGKTGTTQNNSDGWFMGITPDLVTGVWVGGVERVIRFRTISLGQGANTALPIWAKYMTKIYEDKNINISKGDFDRPPDFPENTFDCNAVEDKSEKKSSFDNNLF